MTFFKVALFSFLGVATPIVVSLALASYLFTGEGRFASVSTITETTLVEPPVESDVGPKVIKVGKGVGYARVKSDPVLDIDDQRTLLVSLLVRFNTLPAAGLRHNIITKYERTKSPYAGWGFGVRRLTTSFRPEIYLKNSRGKGGWFSYSDIEIVPEKWYAVTLVIQPQEFAALYVQGIQTPFEEVDGEQRLSTLSPDTPVQFFGAHDISKLGIRPSDSDVILGATRSGKEGFRGEVALVLFASTERPASSVEEYIKLLDGGPSYVAETLPKDDIGLWVTIDGVDRSRYARAITFEGEAASWQATQ